MKTLKGIILAGGTGSRLYPMTLCVNKQLLPVYDKPMIYYPISTLISSGIKDILIISGPYEMELYKKLLGNGSQWGINFSYALQEKPEGLAQALIIGEQFLDNHPCCMILGDNLFFSSDLNKKIQSSISDDIGAKVFAYRVNDPQRYGVVEFDENMQAVSIEEKPLEPKSSYAVTGLYIFDQHAPAYAKTLKKSARGELEITDLNMIYLNKKQLNVEILSRGTAWLDTGTANSLMDASDFVRIIQTRQGILVGSPEESAYNNGFIDSNQLLDLAKSLEKSAYGLYLINLAKGLI